MEGSNQNNFQTAKIAIDSTDLEFTELNTDIHQFAKVEFQLPLGMEEEVEREWILKESENDRY